MDTEKVWGKIKKTVVDGVTVAAEKTEEYTRMGRAKLDVLGIRRKITRMQTKLGTQVYTAVKDGKTNEFFDSNPLKTMVSELSTLETELENAEKIYRDLLNRVQSDVEDVKKKAKSGMEEIKTKTKTHVDRMKAKSKTEKTAPESETEKPVGTPSQ